MTTADIKKILIFLAVCLVLAVQNLSAEERTIIYGGRNGWPQMAQLKNVTTGKGRFGYTCLQLATNSPAVTPDTDLLLHFEDQAMADSSGNYTILKNNFFLTDKSVQGKACALSRGTSLGMLLHGKQGSVFGSSGTIGSFSIEFWLAPSVAGNGETILAWRSSRNTNNYPTYQTITILFVNNKIEWNFANLFDGYTKNDGEVVMTGISNIIPDKWSFHKITFDEGTGLLEYRVNGSVEALQYLTTTGHESGSVYLPVLGVPADIELCPSYMGRIDDFRITRQNKPVQSPADTGSRLGLDKYDTAGGRFVTEPILTSPGSVLNTVTAITDIPAQTDVRLYVRSGDNFYGWTDTDPEWIPVNNGTAIENVTGLYFQVAVELYPDGAGTITPSVTQLAVEYTERPAPLPPFTISAKAGDCSVTLSWGYSVDETTGGYYVFYGERPGEYLGRIAVQGASPINVGNNNSLTLTGLKAGTIYYFAVSSWSKYDDHITGQLSREVYARPYGGSPGTKSHAAVPQENAAASQP